MTQKLVAQKETPTPASVANDLFIKVKEIENAIHASQSHVKEVEDRGILKTIFSSTSTDLVHISKSQNRINDLMLQMINEIITLNVMSFSFLAGVMEEFEKRVAEGMRDANGHIVKLSSVGKSFADSAASIFNKIIEGSRSTRETIALNTEQIEQIRLALSAKAELDEEQSIKIASLEQAIEEKDVLDDRQSMEIEALKSSLQQEQQRLGQVESDLSQGDAFDRLLAGQLTHAREQIGLHSSQIDRLDAALANLASECGALRTEHADTVRRFTAAEQAHIRQRKFLWTAVGCLAVAVLVMAARVFGVF